MKNEDMFEIIRARFENLGLNDYGLNNLIDFIVDCSKHEKFQVGKRYETLEGKIVTIVSENNNKFYETVLGDDNIYRYNRPFDWGRTTGSSKNCPTNLRQGEV